MKTHKTLSLSQRYSADGTDIAFFSAQIEDDGQFSTNRSIADQELYRAHRDETNQAFNAFEDEAYAIAQKVKEEGLCNY